MSIKIKGFASFILVVTIALAGCGGRGKVQTAHSMSSGGSLISIEAKSYSFSPNEIRVRPGLLAIEIKNVSASRHNFTLKDPRGKILKSVDVKPKTSVIINVELPASGTYEFDCNRTFHTTLGMKGRIVVEH